MRDLRPEACHKAVGGEVYVSSKNQQRPLFIIISDIINRHFTLPNDTVRMEHALRWRRHGRRREREMTVICSVDQSAFTQYQQGQRGEEERREEVR